MHIIPSEHLSAVNAEAAQTERRLFPLSQIQFISCSFSDGCHRPVGTGKESGRFVQNGSLFWGGHDRRVHSGRPSQHSLRVSVSSCPGFCPVLTAKAIFSGTFPVSQGENHRLRRCCRQLLQSPAGLEVHPPKHQSSRSNSHRQQWVTPQIRQQWFVTTVNLPTEDSSSRCCVCWHLGRMMILFIFPRCSDGELAKTHSAQNIGQDLLPFWIRTTKTLKIIFKIAF